MLARAARPKALPLHADTALGDDATVIVTPARPATARGVDSLGSLGTAHRPAWQGTPLSSSAAGTGSGAYQPASHRFARHRRDGHRLQPTGWDPLTLGSIERALETGVEPMARLIARPMVRQAARQCADVASLTMELAQHVATAAATPEIHCGSDGRPAGLAGTDCDAAHRRAGRWRGAAGCRHRHRDGSRCSRRDRRCAGQRGRPRARAGGVAAPPRADRPDRRQAPPTRPPARRS